MAWQKIPMLVTPENTHTVFGPLAELVAVAKEIERALALPKGPAIFANSADNTGLEVNMGRTVVLQIGGIHLVTCELKSMTIDPALYRSVGLEPAEARIVVVKTASGFRSGYADLAQAIYILDTPGYCPPNLRSLTYARAPRPLYPLDLDFEGWVLALI